MKVNYILYQCSCSWAVPPVLVQLDEPLWTPTSGPEAVAMDVMGLCVQLEAVLLQSKVHVRELCPLLTCDPVYVRV